MNSTNSEKPFYADLQILISILLLAATLYISGFRAFILPYFIFYILAVLQILLLFSGYMYERREFRTNLSDLLLLFDKWFFILVFSSLVYVISQSMIIKVKELDDYYTYLIPFIFSLVTAIMLVFVVNEINVSDKFKFKVYPEKIDIYCSEKDEDYSINEEESSLDILIKNDSKKDTNVSITLQYDNSALEVTAGTIFGVGNTANFKLSKGDQKYIGVNISCKKRITENYSLATKVVFNNKLRFEKSILIHAIGYEQQKEKHKC